MVADLPSCGNVRPGMGRLGWQGYPAAQVAKGLRGGHHRGPRVSQGAGQSRLGPRTGASRAGGEVQRRYRTIKIRTFPAAGTATTHAHADVSVLHTRIVMHWPLSLMASALDGHSLRPERPVLAYTSGSPGCRTAYAKGTPNVTPQTPGGQEVDVRHRVVVPTCCSLARRLTLLAFTFFAQTDPVRDCSMPCPHRAGPRSPGKSPPRPCGL